LIWTRVLLLVCCLFLAARVDEARAVPVTITSSLGGTARIAPGRAIRAGFELWRAGRHPRAGVSISGAGIAVSGRCPDGSATTVAIRLGAARYGLGAARDGVERIVHAPASLCAGAPLTARTATFVADVDSATGGGLELAFHFGKAFASAPVHVRGATERARPRAPAQPALRAVAPGLRIATAQTVDRASHHITYRITVTNTSGSALAVTVADPGCDAGSLSPLAAQTMLAGSSLAWECWHTVREADGAAYRNTAAAVAIGGDGLQYGPVANTSVASRRLWSRR